MEKKKTGEMNYDPGRLYIEEWLFLLTGNDLLPVDALDMTKILIVENKNRTSQNITQCR